MLQTLNETQVESRYQEILKQVINHFGHDKLTWSDELDEKGRELIGDSFLGAFPADKLPEMKEGESALLNTETAKEGGEHWVALIRINGKHYGYDSFARPINTLIPETKKTPIKDSDLSDKEQKDIEESCGQRSIAWILLVHELGIDSAVLV